MIWSALFLAISGIALLMLWRDVQKGATSIMGFTKPVEQAQSPTNFWLAVAYLNLGEVEQARKYLTVAMKNSTTRRDHDLYAAKLDRINAERAN